jgi:hypothetical protein
MLINLAYERLQEAVLLLLFELLIESVMYLPIHLTPNTYDSIQVTSVSIPINELVQLVIDTDIKK